MCKSSSITNQSACSGCIKKRIVFAIRYTFSGEKRRRRAVGKVRNKCKEHKFNTIPRVRSERRAVLKKRVMEEWEEVRRLKDGGCASREAGGNKQGQVKGNGWSGKGERGLGKAGVGGRKKLGRCVLASGSSYPLHF